MMNKKIASVLAKRPLDPDNPERRETLLGHSRDVVEAFLALFGTKESPTRLGKNGLDFFN